MAGYGDDSGFNTWLTSMGRVLPVGAPSVAVLRERGSVYIDATYGPRFIGVPTAPVTQEREWPRMGASIHDVELADSAIPIRVVTASYEAAWMEASSPGILSVIVNPNAMVKRNKVDVIEQEFFEPGLASGSAIMASLSSTIEGLLSPLLDPSSNYPMVLVV